MGVGLAGLNGMKANLSSQQSWELGLGLAWQIYMTHKTGMYVYVCLSDAFLKFWGYKFVSRVFHWCLKGIKKVG